VAGLDSRTHLGVDVLPVLDGVRQHGLLDSVGECSHDGLDETLALLFGVDLTDERVCLTEVVVLGVQAVRAAHQFAVGLPAVVDRALLLLVGPSVRVRGVDRRIARVVVLHLPLLVVRVRLRHRGIDRQLVEVRADPVALRIRVGEHTAHEHLVRRDAGAGHRVRRAEGGLLDLCEVVRRVLVEREPTDLDERVVLLRPGLREVEGVEPVGLRLFVGHDLDGEGPRRVVAAFDGVEQVPAVHVRVLAGHPTGLLVAHVLHALVGVEVVLNPELLTLGVDPHVGVRGVAVHVPPCLGQTARPHQVRHLVSRFGGERPEVPLHVVRPQARIGQTLLRVDEVGELHRITDEEDGRVVAHHVEVALFGVELQRESAHVTPGVGRTELTGDGGKACEHRGLLPRLEEIRLRIGGDILGDLELTEGAGALCVRAALGDALTVEASELLDQGHIVEHQRTVGAHTQRVRIGFPARTGFGRRRLRGVVSGVLMIGMLRHHIS
jgi:hypothetical protein